MASDLFRLDGKIVAVVGAGGGIGEAVALACGAQGAHVVCLDIHGGNAVSVASKMQSLPRKRWRSGFDVIEKRHFRVAPGNRVDFEREGLRL